MHNTSYKKLLLLLLLLLLPSAFLPNPMPTLAARLATQIETAPSPVQIKTPYEADSKVWTLNSAVVMPR